MSVETITPTGDGSISSRTVSTRCVDSDSSTESTSDSSNSLFAENTEKECVENCMEVKIKCSLVNKCPSRDNLNSKKKRRKVCCNTLGQCVWGVLLIIMSVIGLVFTPLDFMLWEKMNMRPGLPPYEWWADPPDEVKLRTYVFNITNHERFMEGLDEKLNVKEIGPIVYLEKLLHSNIRFNDNGTMTYTAKRYPIYLPHDNTVDLNATLIVPNLAVLGISSFLHDANYFVRAGFRFMVNTHHSEMFLKKTVYEYLWDYQEPVLDMSKSLAPGLVPVNNMGMLARVYADFVDEVTVKIGSRWGHQQFFQIDRFRGHPQLPGYDPNTCPDRIFGSSEGVMYQQRLRKQDVLLYWRKTVCKLMPLYFDSEMTVEGVPVYRYNLSESVFDRVTNGTDCYDTEPSLPSGVSDGSKCYFDFPMVVSYPHFYTGGVPKDYFVTGLEPDRFKHNSFVIVEPLTGTPFQSVARMQSNLRIHNLSGFTKEYNKLSNQIIPLFWAEYNQEGLPSRIRHTIFFATVVLPPLSTVILASTLLLGFYLVTKYIYKTKLQNDKLKTLLHFKSKNVNTLAKNTILSYEKEAFLKMPS